MRRYPYSKYSGAGNTFFLIDNREGNYLLSPSLIRYYCQSPINSADGMIFLERSLHAHVRMRIFNADGSEAEMCGNGLRVLATFLRDLGWNRKELVIESKAYSKHQVLFLEDEIAVEMNSPSKMLWNISLPLEMGIKIVHFLNTGVPHTVLFLETADELKSFPVSILGKCIRHHSLFLPSGTNVNFAYLQSDNQLIVRTFERGVEAETLACGTGATATALAAAHCFSLNSPLCVETRSKENLRVSFKKEGHQFSEVFLQGGAKRIDEGFFEEENP